MKVLVLAVFWKMALKAKSFIMPWFILFLVIKIQPIYILYNYYDYYMPFKSLKLSLVSASRI